ncbi:MAG: neutral zinc metallopeptidase [Actinomycetota bacterium]|nr:neutral zinc metallopeptidase [Actinomycetota bacterium]
MRRDPLWGRRQRGLASYRPGGDGSRAPDTTDGPRRERPRRVLGLLALQGGLLVLVAACGGAGAVLSDAWVNERELANPSVHGDEVLAELPEVNPPIGSGDQRIVGSRDMTTTEFVRAVGGDLNEMWRASFEEGKYAYSDMKFVVYEEPRPISGCTGVARPERGPFYCGKTGTVYYPLSWVAPRGERTPEEIGDIAVAVILGHEAGHHVQSLLGILGDTSLHTIQRELQADCLAGIWGRSVYEEGSLERGDVGEAVRILEDMADLPGIPPTDPTAHGDERERVDAFMRGFETGDASKCRL